MEDNVFGVRPFSTITVVICLVSVLSMTRPGVCSSWDDEELRLREDATVREVNETAQAEIEQIKAARRTRYIDEELGYVPDVNLISSDELAAIEKQRAEKEKTIRTRFGYDINSLEQLEAGVSQEQTAGVSRKAPARIKPVAPGTVTGIAFCDNNGAALIGDEIVRENDIVLGVKVVRITPDYVEFERQGKKWKQEVGESPPPSIWEQPAPPSK